MPTSFDRCLQGTGPVTKCSSLFLDFDRVPSHRLKLFVAQAGRFTVCHDHLCQVSEEQPLYARAAMLSTNVSRAIYEMVSIGQVQSGLSRLLRNMLRLGRGRGLPARAQR